MTSWLNLPSGELAIFVEIPEYRDGIPYYILGFKILAKGGNRSTQRHTVLTDGTHFRHWRIPSGRRRTYSENRCVAAGRWSLFDENTQYPENAWNAFVLHVPHLQAKNLGCFSVRTTHVQDPNDHIHFTVHCTQVLYRRAGVQPRTAPYPGLHCLLLP